MNNEYNEKVLLDETLHEGSAKKAWAMPKFFELDTTDTAGKSFSTQEFGGTTGPS